MHPSISIITPSYNQGKFIERTILSVLNQNISNLEYLIMDGGSTDETLQILKKYESKYKWISEKDNGQSHAINKGFLNTKGEIVGWLNSDDIYYENTLKTILHFFSVYPEIDIVYGEANHIDENDLIINKYPTEAWNVDQLKNICYLCQPAVFFRRKILEKHGYLNENLHFCMDYEFWLRLADKNVKFYFLDEILAGSRLHPNTKTLGSRIQVHKEIIKVFKKRYKKIPESWIASYAIALTEQQTTHHKKKFLRSILSSVYFLALALFFNKKIKPVFLLKGIKWFYKKTKKIK